MILIKLINNCQHYKKCAKVVAIFGIGLVGTSINKHLEKSGSYESLYIDLPWDNTDLQKIKLLEIKKELISQFDYILKRYKIDEIYFDIVWSAGKAGFSASADEVQNEFICFKKIILSLLYDTEVNQPFHKTIHLISSAGGIYEGSRKNQTSLTPSPVRPYGHLKIEQERFILSLRGNISTKIYRLSSVYGHINFKRRMGLIPTLIYNGLNYKVSSIFGNMHTLRDYIFCDDIGKYIGNKIIENNLDPGSYLLASGKPTSILEVKKLIEDIIGRKIFIKYNIDKSNYRDICFQKKQLPENLDIIGLNVGIKNVYYNWLISS